MSFSRYFGRSRMIMQDSLQGPAWFINTHAACLIQYALDSLAGYRVCRVILLRKNRLRLPLNRGMLLTRCRCRFDILDCQ